MAYTDRPIDRVVERAAVPVADYHDRVRWGPIIAGLVVALSTQLVLSALGAAIGLTTIAGSDAPRSNVGDVGSAVGIWSIISLLIALFIGGWVTARACGPMNRSTALLNGAILWATTLAISAWLLTSGVTGAFGIVASNAGEIINQAQQGGVPAPDATTGATAQQTRDIAGNAAKVGWSFALGSLLGLVAALIGASVGTRHPRATATTTTTVRE
ncbi:hypothetical protein IQ268_23685 [Oculatella sp. LEGE 06141]|uniref:hypothetical protein n=1 Tax=Oculatella sp. LEGE 06141 TaxID=1828648 RepID=UPI001882761B|nr:hypothetical protein [Oculatella sp. LEGE 06141]MBE9181569.1 hypothetical protein [Oculatella sp. LEGE 06141]